MTRIALSALMVVLIATGVVAGTDLVADVGDPDAPATTPFERYLAVGADDIPLLPGDPPQPSLGSRATNSSAPLSAESVASSGTETLSADELIVPVSQISPLGAFDSSDANAIPTLTRSIAGITNAEDAVNDGFGEGIPPDPMIAAGPDHVVTVVNSSYEIHDKAGNQLVSEAFNSFFAGLGLIGNPFDPKVRYDQYRDRFVIVVLDGRPSTPNQSQILIAVSDDSNPIGTWHKTKINSVVDIGGINHWADYPGLGMDADALFITNNMYEFDIDGGEFGGQRLWIVAKDPFYAGGALPSPTVMDPWTLAERPELASTTMPSHAFGALPISVGTFLMVYSGLSNGNEFVALLRIDDPLGTPTVEDFQLVPLGDVDDLSVSPLPGAPQSGSSATIATNDRRALDLIWRNNRLWGVFTVVPPSGADAGQTTAHWVEIDTANLSNLSRADQGTVGGNDIDPNAHTFFPSISVDASGNMAMSFALSSPNHFGGAYYSGRLAGDPAGTTRSTGILRSGVASYDPTNDGFAEPRWGDYSGIALDPSNEAEFWAFGEFARATDDWGTYIGRFSFADTPSSPQSVSATVNSALVEATVTWVAPADDGGLPVTGYLVLSTPESLSTTTSATSTQAKIGGLSIGVAYTFTVTPSNNQGFGATSSPSNSITASTVPGPPTGVTALAGLNSASVSWSAPIDNGGTMIVDYTVTSSPDDVMVASTSTSAIVNGLTADTSYTFTVTARNFAGNSSSSVPSAPVTTHAVPDAPTGATSTPKVESAVVSWNAPADDGGSPITLYTVTSAPEGIVATTTATSTTVTGLTNGTNYTFSVVATNAVGNSPPSASSTGVVPGPGIVFDPALLVLVNVGDSATTTIVAQAVDASTDRVIANLQIPDELTVSLISCGGIFASATSSTSTVSGGILVECALGGTVSTTTGVAIELTVTRATSSPATIILKTGATSTAFFAGGATTTPVVIGELNATEGVNVDGVISLQSVSSTSSFAAIGPTVTIVSVADPSASSSVAASNDGSFAFATIAPGTYDLIATASGFAPMQLSNQVIGLTDITVISGTLSAGLVNGDEYVNLEDILLTIGEFGTSGATRPDGNGNFTDVDADTYVNLKDILLTISRFGLSGTQIWQ